MASDQFSLLAGQGFRRTGAEGLTAPPEAFTIVGLDITAEKLTALYPAKDGREGAAHARARAIIKGVRDHTRVNEEPPEWFIASMAVAGVVEDVTVANLGPDKNQKAWIVICKGRKRTMGLRAYNKRVQPHERFELSGRIKAFPNTKDVNAELVALETNTISNLHVAMRPSQQAAHAVMLAESNLSPANIAIRIGAKDADHVALLLMLAKCVPEVQEAVDADRVALSKAKTLHKLAPEEQVRRVARASAGENRGAQNAAAPPRAKTRPARIIASLADAFREKVGGIPAALSREDVALGVLTFTAGGDAPEWLKPYVAKASGEEEATS